MVLIDHQVALLEAPEGSGAGGAGREVAGAHARVALGEAQRVFERQVLAPGAGGNAAATEPELTPAGFRAAVGAVVDLVGIKAAAGERQLVKQLAALDAELEALREERRAAAGGAAGWGAGVSGAKAAEEAARAREYALLRVSEDRKRVQLALRVARVSLQKAFVPVGEFAVAAGEDAPGDALGGGGGLRAVHYVPGGRVACGTSHNAVVEVDTASGAARVRVAGHRAGAARAESRAKGSVVPAGAGAGARAHLAALDAEVRGGAAEPDRALVASGGRDGCVVVRDAAGARAVVAARALAAGVCAVAWAPAPGGRLAAGLETGTVHVLDVAAPGGGLPTLQTASAPVPAEAACAARFAPDGAALAVGYSAGEVRLFDTTTGARLALLHVLRAHSAAVSALDFCAARAPAAGARAAAAGGVLQSASRLAGELPPPPLRTYRTRCVLHPVLIGHAASFTPY